MTEQEEKDAQLIWDYMRLEHVLKACDAILVFGSLDERVAEYGAKLFLEGFGDLLIFSGGAAHQDDLLRTNWKEKTEVAHFASIARSMGVPEEKALIEDKATNTGENIQNVQKLLRERGINIRSLLLVQKPYMERRTYATFKKQWSGDEVDIVVTSPPLSYEEYFNDDQPKERIVNIMVGDLQRIKVYPKKGFQIPQDIPVGVWAAYERLVAAGYDGHLIREG